VAAREAELYQSLHRGNPGDVDFYARSCQGARNVLELGAGYGRVALALAERGHEVTGLELDAGLLELAQLEHRSREHLAGRVRLLFGDMRAFELESGFERVIIPYSGLYCLLSVEEVEACLGHAFRHLVPGGHVCLDGYYADAFHSESEPEDTPPDELEPVVSLVHDDELLRVYERSTWDKETQRIDVFYEYRNEREEAVYTGVVKQRYLLAAELEEKLLAAGFVDCQSFADFTPARPTPETETIAFVAKKPQLQSASKTASA